jgi:transposase
VLVTGLSQSAPRDQSAPRRADGARQRRSAGAGCLSVRVCTLIKDMREEWCDLDRRICAFDNEFAARVREDEGARRLATIPGIGVLNATALVAAIGDGQSFARGRDLSAWLGLFPGSRRPAASRA